MESVPGRPISCDKSVLSGYICSHITALASIPTHEKILRTYQEELVVACRDFLEAGKRKMRNKSVGS